MTHQVARQVLDVVGLTVEEGIRPVGVCSCPQVGYRGNRSKRGVVRGVCVGVSVSVCVCV